MGWDGMGDGMGWDGMGDGMGWVIRGLFGWGLAGVIFPIYLFS